MKTKYRHYYAQTLTAANKQCKENKMSLKKAAKIYNVYIPTLRDRVFWNVDHDSALIGKHPMFTLDEELKLVHHIKTMAGFGYGYTRQECVNLASDYAVQLSKRGKHQPVSMKWLRGFLVYRRTDGRTDRPTDRPTSAKQYTPQE